MNHSKSEKDTLFYQAALEAWFQTKFEHDKSLLTLSAGGVGLLITLITSKGASSLISLWLYIASTLCFLMSIAALLKIFKRNATYLETVISSESSSDDHLLGKLDSIATYTFGMGVVLTSLVGFYVAIDSYDNSKGTKTMPSNERVKSSSTFANDSVNGLNKLQQNNDLSRSLNGAASLKPQSSNTQTNSSNQNTTQPKK